tara:strand:- start:672 stop:827 length:156 start_codon:yes stop_codon:yes gene_type:complete
MVGHIPNSGALGVVPNDVIETTKLRAIRVNHIPTIGLLLLIIDQLPRRFIR